MRALFALHLGVVTIWQQKLINTIFNYYGAFKKFPSLPGRQVK